MAKRSQRRPVRYEKDQLGCMWGFISIFDLRHGRFTQKLLSDKRRGVRPAAGDGNAINKFGMLTRIENNDETFDGEEGKTVVADAGKPSVKKLMEEEMISEQDTKKEINNVEVEPNHSHKEQGSTRKKTSKRMKKARKKSCDSISDLDATENLKAGQPCHQNSQHQCTSCLDIDNVMEEFCHQIHQKSYMKHVQLGDLDVQSNQKNPEFEEKLREAIKLLISQKGIHLSEDGEIHPSNEQLTDAFQILGSDAELFVKHLQDPNSLFVKCIQNFPDAQLENNEDSVSLAGSNLSEQELGNLRQSDELVNHKQRKFFRRKVKSQERRPSNGEKTTQASNRIVILKPGPTGSQNPETESTVGSSPESHYVIRNKEPNERIGSPFFLSEIKRKLKYAMGKEHQRIGTSGIQKGLSYESQNLGDRDRGIKENVGMNSPTKDHFFIEKIARPAGVKKVDKTSKLKDCELGTEHKSADLPMQRVSNIYIEAKKHLSEMLSTGDENLVSSSGRSPKTLGRILSLPEYNFSPVGSPGRNWEHGFVTAQMRYVDLDKFCQVNENASSLKQDSHVSHLGQTESLETEPCISVESSDNKVEAPTFDSDITVEQIHDNDEKEISFSVGDEMSSRGDADVEIEKTNEIAILEESNVLDAPCQPGSFSIKDDEQNGDESVVCNGQRHSKLKEDLDSSEDNQLPSSPLASPSNSSVTKKLEDLETAIDILERPSPVSVLEPLFAEDDISPASTRSHSVQPLQIEFEEHASSTAVQSIQMKSSVEDKESVFKYVKALLLVSGLNWDELCVKLLSTDQLLDPSLFDEVEFSPNQLCYEQKLLFDLINEVLMEICGHYFGCLPWVSFVKPYIRPFPDKENALSEVWEGVMWHLIPLPLPRTLERTVRKDMAKSGIWMDLRFEADSIGIEMGDAILEELMEDTILSYVFETPESECPLLLAKLKESESSTNSESGCPVPAAELIENEGNI